MPERVVCPPAGLYGPGSMTWRVNREALVLLGGGRALLLQIAHPLVAAGVAAHSRFRTEPLARLWRTLELMLTIAFGDGPAVMRALGAIEAVHARVRGELSDAVGPFPRGTHYDASDPELLRWVHATLVDTSLLVYDRFVAPLAPAERARYWEEAKRSARLFGIPDALLPATFEAFRGYVDGMIEGDTLAVGPAGRAVAASIVRPPLAPGLRHGFALSAVVSAGLLPPPIRDRFGLGWGRRREAALRGLAATTRRVVPHLPGVLRFLPHARRAALRS